MAKRTLLAHHQLFQGSSTTRSTSHKSDTYELKLWRFNEHAHNCIMIFLHFWRCNTTLICTTHVLGKSASWAKVVPHSIQISTKIYWRTGSFCHVCITNVYKPSKKSLEYWKQCVSIDFWGQIPCSKLTFVYKLLPRMAPGALKIKPCSGRQWSGKVRHTWHQRSGKEISTTTGLEV